MDMQQNRGGMAAQAAAMVVVMAYIVCSVLKDLERKIMNLFVMVLG